MWHGWLQVQPSTPPGGHLCPVSAVGVLGTFPGRFVLAPPPSMKLSLGPGLNPVITATSRKVAAGGSCSALVDSLHDI